MSDGFVVLIVRGTGWPLPGPSANDVFKDSISATRTNNFFITLNLKGNDCRKVMIKVLYLPYIYA